MGAISMVAVTIACNPTVRDSAAAVVLGSAGQRVDLRQSGFGENDAALRAGGSTGSARRSVLFTTCQMLVQEFSPRQARNLRIERWIKKLSKFEALIIALPQLNGYQTVVVASPERYPNRSL